MQGSIADPSADTKPMREVLVVDPAVGQSQVLLNGLRDGIDVVYLAPTGHALGQIAEALAGRPGVSTLHILGHGEAGALLLAGERLDADELVRRPAALASMAAALAPDATVVLYGCAVMAGATGRSFVDRLEAELGVAVVASAKPVGAAALGGTWDLPGLPTLDRLAFSQAAREAYAGMLASTTGTAGNDALTGTAAADDISGLDGNDVISGLAGDDTILGGLGNDTLWAGEGADRVSGEAGNDTLYGGDGTETLYGGDGNDFLYGQTDADLLFGDDGNDGVSGGDGNDSLYGGGGNDTLISATGNDVMYGGEGVDWLWGQHGNDVAYGGAGSDTVSGDAGEDTLFGEAGDDTLYGGSANDLIYGGDGNDVISGMAGADTLFGGDGNDTFSGNAAAFNEDTIGDFVVADTIVITGTDLSSLNGTAASGTIDLGGGNTLTLAGVTSANGTFAAVHGGGNTTITLTAPSGSGGGGGSSSDLVVNDANSDTTGGSRTVSNTGGTSGSAAIVQNTGNNGNVVTATLPPSVSITSEGPATAQSGTAASDTLISAIDVRDTVGESGAIGSTQGFLNSLGPAAPLDVRTIVPTVGSGITNDDPIAITGTSGGTQVEAFVIDMRSIAGKTLQVDNIEFVSVMGNATVTGGAGNNYAVGDDNAQFMSLGAGDDTLYGGGGADTIGSADGNDVLLGEAGADRINGGVGNDTLWGGLEADVVYGNQDGDLVYGNQSDDTLFGGQACDTLFGGQDTDVVYGNLADDVLYGNLADDTLYGGQGNDLLYGGQSGDGMDVLVGGEGDDTLNGGEGADSLIGGCGRDLFVIGDVGGADTITDFDGMSGDRVQIAAHANGTSIDSFAELQAAASDMSDGGVQIALGSGNSLQLMGVSSGELQADWFVFV